MAKSEGYFLDMVGVSSRERTAQFGQWLSRLKMTDPGLCRSEALLFQMA